MSRKTVRDENFKAKARFTALMYGPGLLAGFWLASAHADLPYTPRILDDPILRANAFLDQSQATLGDVNGDGIPDLLKSAYLQDVGGSPHQGQAFVFSGADGSLLYTLDDPVPQAGAGFGVTVAGPGDVDGDGRPDILVGAPNQDSNGNTLQGQVFVFSGADGNLLHILNAPTPQANALFGESVAGAGDVDGDGRPDILVGAPGQDVDHIYQGRAFVFSGADGSLLLTLDDPTPQRSADFGWAVAGAGDVDGDGRPDILVGAADQTVGGNDSQGQAFVFSGADGSLLYTLDDPVPQAGAGFGVTVAGPGDVDGDGRPDTLVGAPRQTVDGMMTGQTVLFVSRSP
ncbi:VCBS repeat-containing protein [Methylocaldum sp. MU1018]